MFDLAPDGYDPSYATHRLRVIQFTIFLHRLRITQHELLSFTSQSKFVLTKRCE